jgi:ribonuclease P protein component
MSADRNKRSERLTLPRSAILRGNTHFDRLFKEGNRLSAPSMDLRYMVFPDSAAGCLVAFAAGRKLGGAVVRNRCKRHMREAYRLNQGIVRGAFDSGLFGVHGVFIARRADLTAAQTQADCRLLLTRLLAQLPA